MMRTYAGHSTAKRSNELYRGNLAKGQTGLSVAFDLPTQTGYDADHELARGEVGKVGVPVAHKGDMHALMDGIPLDRMNTSMTINATAAWLLALYIVVAEENGIDPHVLAGTTQNDIIKEYLSRGTYAFPPAPSMRLIGDMVAYTIDEVPKWNPINVCSYHLQEAGATPVQEIAFALSTAQAVLDEVRPRVGDDKMGAVFGRISFFVNAGVRFVEEHAKLRAMGILWEELGRSRYGVSDEKQLRFRYGVQVNSLGLTESQPENNVQRIVLEALAVSMGRNARARAIQLPAWNEALGLPRPWDQQWSLRIQQVLAYETDLLEYPDIFEGSVVMDGLVAELLEGAREEIARVEEQGGAVEAVPYMKAALVESHRERIGRIERGEQVLVGVNRYEETEPSPLTEGVEGGIMVVDPAVEAEAIEALGAWRRSRDAAAVEAALAELAAGRGLRRERHARHDRGRSGGRDDRRVGGDAARRVRLLPRPDRGRRGRRAGAGRGARGAARGRRGRVRAARPHAQDPRRQAGARRPLQRRRADRRAGARRRHGGRLRGDPADAVADRAQRGRRGRPRDRPLDPLRLPPRADPRRDQGAARGGRRRHPARRRRHHPRRRRRAAAGRGRRGGLHAEGLRAHPHPPRRRRDRGGAERHRLRRRVKGGADLGRRLAEKDLSAAPAALNLVENRSAAARPEIAELLAAVSPAALGGEAPAHIVGVTGPPGAGKSTLLSVLVAGWRGAGRSVAVLAVDPSSKRSGGALLGDRARIDADPADRGIFIRSMAAGERLGGLAPATRAAAQALAAAFDVVVIETVGVGQSETEVAEAADTVAVIVQPGSGDALQFLKAGIMEVPDALVVTKADLGTVATRAVRDLRAAMRSLGSRTPVLAVSSVHPVSGVGELIAALDAHREGLDLHATRVRTRRLGALADFVAEHGARGLRELGGRREAERFLAEQPPEADEPALVAALEARAR